MLVRYADYDSFTRAIEKAGYSTQVFCIPAIPNTQGFSAIAAVLGTQVVLRFDAEEEPGTFAADFPKAIIAFGLDG